MFPLNKTNKNVLFLICLTILVVTASTLWYYIGMNQLENRPRTLIESLEWVTQTMTTVGYGQDAPWSSQFMFLLAIMTQIAAISIVFLSIPIVVTPWIEKRMAIQPPTSQNKSNHVLMCGYSPIIDKLIAQLEERKLDYVLVDDNREKMVSLHRSDHPVVYGSPDNPGVLEEASFSDARMVILDGTDQQLVSMALSAQDFENDPLIVAVADDPDRERHLKSAGVDEVIFPKEKIGEVLSHKILVGLGRHSLLEEHIDTRLEIQELPVLPSSSLVNQQIGECGIHEATHADIIGLWRQGQFHNHPHSDDYIRENDILVAAGSSEALDKLADHLESRPRKQQLENVMIIGYGKEGTAADEVLKRHDISPVRVDKQDLENTITGDGKDPEILQKANVKSMDSVLIAVSSDDTAIFITLMVRDLNPEAEIVVQINESESSFPVYRAGANYVQALDQLTARLLAEYVLDEDLIYEELNLQVGRFTPGNLVNNSPDEEGLGPHHNVTVVAVDRDNETVMDINENFTFKRNDILYLAGAPESVRSVETQYNLGNPQEEQ